MVFWSWKWGRAERTCEETATATTTTSTASGGSRGSGVGGTHSVAVQAPSPTPIARALQSRGVTPEVSELLSPLLEHRAQSLSSAEARALLDGVAIALDAQQDVTGQLAHSLRGLKEVERMMGAFSGELSKLDEVLEVLAAYVRRMRSTGSGDSVRVLH